MDVQSLLWRRDPIQTTMSRTNKNTGARQALRGNRPNASAKSRRSRKSRRSGVPMTQPIQSRAVYTAPVAVAQLQQFPNRLQNKSRRLQNSELVSSISGSVAFTANRFVVNPGLPATFPWLSGIAQEWQQYHFHKLCFRYVTRASTATVGSVILSPDYNPIDLSPTTEQQASNTQDAVEDSVWREINCVLDPRAMFPIGPRKQIRAGNVPGDLASYDACRFYVCTVEEADSSAIGKLWVDYDVELFVPQTSPSLSTGPTRISEFGRATAQTFTTGVSAAFDFDAAFSDPLRIGNDSAGVFTPPLGTYLLLFTVSFNDSTGADTSTVTVEIQKNSASLTNPMISTIIGSNATGAADAVTMSTMAIVGCSGSDTVRVLVTYTSATGTLTSLATSSRLEWMSA